MWIPVFRSIKALITSFRDIKGDNTNNNRGFSGLSLAILGLKL
jgi:hypothetical protein